MAIRQKQLLFSLVDTLANLIAKTNTKEVGERAFAVDLRREYVTDGTDWSQLRGVRVLNASKLDLVTAEPAAPAAGDTYIAAATGASSVTTTAVTAEYVYEWDGAAWVELVPVAGDTAFSGASGLRFDGTVWQVIGAIHVVEELVPTATDTIPDLGSVPASVTDVELIVNGQSLWSGAATPAFSIVGQAITWSAANAGFPVETYDVIVARYLAA